MSHDHSNAQTDPTDLVCKRCWTVFFSSQNFWQLCQSPCDDVVVEYEIDKSECRASALRGCNWCALILEGDAQSIGAIPPEYRNTSSVHIVRLRSISISEDFTPIGNNRLQLNVNGSALYLTVFTSVGNAASDVVTARPLQYDISSNQAFKRMGEWLEACAAHSECKPQSACRLPTRVIEVSSEQNNGLRIIPTNGLQGYYAALSYCWGTNQPGVTTRANFNRRLLALDRSELSKTVQEAIVASQRIGLRYLWVDAICIVQDDDEDKAIEIQQMCDTYQNAHVTIVAANAANSNQGFLQPRPSPESSAEIPFWSASGCLGSVWLRQEGWYDDESEPVNTRGWTFQERMLSPRLIVFASHTVQFQCQRATINLGDSLHIPSGLGSWRPPYSMIQSSQAYGVEASMSEAAIEAWKKVIAVYSQRRVSYDDDRLIALAALAQAFHAHIKEPYLAGLWSGSALPSQLLWQPAGFGKHSTYQIYIAPSWSWASVPIPVSFPIDHRLQESISTSVEILSSTITPGIQKLPFGKVSHGSLTLKAQIKVATFVPPHGLHWEGAHQAQPRRPSAPPSGVYKSDFAMPDSVIYAQLDALGLTESIRVLCLAIASRSYTYEGFRYTAVDGLLIAPADGAEGAHVYRRIGCFFGAMDEEFASPEIRKVVLV